MDDDGQYNELMSIDMNMYIIFLDLKRFFFLLLNCTTEAVLFIPISIYKSIKNKKNTYLNLLCI